MKKNLFPLVQCTLTGIGIGIPVTLICMTALGGWNEAVLEFAVWAAASALFGLVSGLVFYCGSELSLPAAMVLHCIGCLAIAVGACWLCGYAESVGALLAGILPVFVIVYAAVYGFCFLMMKLNEKQINRELDKE